MVWKQFLFQYKQLRKKAKERLEERKQNNVVSAVIAATKNKKIDTIGNGLNREAMETQWET